MAHLYHTSTIRKLFNDGEGKRSAYNAASASATHTEIAADADVDRNVLVIVHCTQTFANGTGTAPTFKVGETSTLEKFFAAATIGAMTIGQKKVIVGTNSATKDLLVTGTVGTGTSTGAIRVTIQTLPLTQ